MGRPKATEKRDHQVNVALTEREYEQVRRAADDVGQRVTDYARGAMLRRQVAASAIAAACPMDFATVEVVRRAGVELNQARRQLATLGHATPPHIDPLLADIRALVAKAIAHDR